MNNPPFSVRLYVTSKNGMPAIELRTLTTDNGIIKQLVTCALYEKPIIIMPIFTKKLDSIASLIQKGILYTKEDKFYFNI